MDAKIDVSEAWDLEDEAFNNIDECYSPTLPTLKTSKSTFLS